MTIYIAFLRGINVGGKTIVKMAELKKLFEELGLMNVKTYIQSGNVLFTSEELEASLTERMESALHKTFGFEITVVIRTLPELERILAGCPFSEEEILAAKATAVGESLYVAMLPREPLAEKLPLVEAYRTDQEEYFIHGRDVYLLFRDTVRTSKLANHLHKLGEPSTVRNWNTMGKLALLGKEMLESLPDHKKK